MEGLTYIPISLNIDRYRLALHTPNVSLHIDELGDGAKYATAILSLCLLIRDTAFLIEEIESHQHVGAITKLIPELIKLANMRNIQLFLTTHSVEVMETLSRLPEEYDIHFFHVENKKGDIEVRHLGRNIVAKLLLDLGVDIRYIDTTKKFIVVEGEDDAQFLKSLLNRYGRDVEELGYLVTAGNKDIIKRVLTALLSTKKEIVVMMDYDKQEKKTLIQSLANAVESRNYKIISQNDNAMEIEGNIRVNLIPMGLYSDEMLKQIGINQFEMEDYCLKLIGIDENLREWVGVTLDELVEIGKRANIDGMNLHKSSTLLRLLAIKKNIVYRDLINHIISNASDQALETTITGELKEFLYKEIGR